MEWIIYWILIILSFILGLLVFINKRKVSGILQVVLSVIVPIWGFIFTLKRDWITNQNELEFLFLMIIQGRIEAILIALLYLVLVIMCIYNLLILIKKIIRW